MTVRIAPPASIWALVASSGWRGRIARCEAKSEPSDQKIGESRTAARPSGSSAPAPPNADGPTRNATPTKPTAIPTMAIRGRRSPRNSRPKMATQTGISAMNRAVMPDGMVCSPKATMPMPPPSSRPPTMKESRHSRRVGGTNRPRSRASDQSEQDAAGDREPDRRHEERRDRLDRDRDPQVRRAPDDVQDEHARARCLGPRYGAGGRRGWHRWLVQGGGSLRLPGWPSPVGQTTARAGRVRPRPLPRRSRGDRPCTADSRPRPHPRASGMAGGCAPSM